MRIEELTQPFVNWQRAQGYAAETLRGTQKELKVFKAYLYEAGITSLEELTRDLIDDFQEYMALKQSKNKHFLSISYRNHVLNATKQFLGWLVHKDYLAHDLGKGIRFAKAPKRLPRHIATQEEMKNLLEQPDTSTLYGFRDRALLELIYSTGLRIGEVRRLKIGQVDMANGYLYVHEGKGGKDRVVPISPGLGTFLNEYIQMVRPKLLRRHLHDYLFPAQNKSGPLCERQIGLIVRTYCHKAGIKKHMTTHTLRHACATHMIQNGAPIRHVQEMLGHTQLNTTQIYTHLTINDLKKAHARYHPRERMKKKGNWSANFFEIV